MHTYHRRWLCRVRWAARSWTGPPPTWCSPRRRATSSRAARLSGRTCRGNTKASGRERSTRLLFFTSYSHSLEAKTRLMIPNLESWRCAHTSSSCCAARAPCGGFQWAAERAWARAAGVEAAAAAPRPRGAPAPSWLARSRALLADSAARAAAARVARCRLQPVRIQRETSWWTSISSHACSRSPKLVQLNYQNGCSGSKAGCKQVRSWYCTGRVGQRRCVQMPAWCAASTSSQRRARAPRGSRQLAEPLGTPVVRAMILIVCTLHCTVNYTVT